MVDINVGFKSFNSSAKFPEYKSKDAAGADLYSSIDFCIFAKQTVKIPLGFALEIPEGFEMEIKSRSGRTANTKLRVLDGNVDSDYRGEVFVIVENISEHDAMIYEGERIAQGKFRPVVRASFQSKEELSDTERGIGGFGHTGM